MKKLTEKQKESLWLTIILFILFNIGVWFIAWAVRYVIFAYNCLG